MARSDNDATNTGADENAVENNLAADAKVVTGEKQQSDAAAVNPNPPGQGIFDAPEGVAVGDVDIDGRDLLVTLPSGEVDRIENAYAEYDRFEVGGDIFPIAWPANIGDPPVVDGSGGNFEVDPGEIDPGLPITPLLPPTELAFGFPEQEEIFLLEDTEPEVVRVTNALVDEDGFQGANADQPISTETPGDGNLVDTGLIVINYNEDVPGDLDAALTLDDLPAYDGQLTSGGQQVVFALDGGDLVGTIDGGATEVIRIAIVSSNDAGNGIVEYTYEVTLSQPVDQPGNDNEDILSLVGVQFTATDSDGDSVSGTVDVGVLDDVPQAFDDGSTSTDDDTPVTVQVLENDVPSIDGDITLIGASVQGGNTVGSASINALTGQVTFTAAPGFDGQATVNYTIEDGDGDNSTASFTVTVRDSTPALEVGGTNVDEDGLGDANADDGLSTESDHGGSASNTGTIAVDYGNDTPGDLDAAVTFNTSGLDGQLTAGGDDVVFRVAGNGDLVGEIDADGNGVADGAEVIRIALTDSTDNGGGFVDYEYTVTLSEAVDQSGNDDEDSIVLDDVSFIVTDSDGSTNSGSFDVTIYDDVPEAIDDGSTATSDTDPVTVDVLSNDISGADDPLVITGVSVVGGTATGTASFNGDDVTFTAAAGFSGSATVNYTIEDADGDEDTASFTVTVRDSIPQLSDTDTDVDEDGLGDANADDGMLTEFAHGGSATNTGTITVNYGNDVPGDLDAAIVLLDEAGLDSELTSGGETVVFALDSGDLVGTIDGGGTEVIRISIDSTPQDNGGGEYEYTYTVTLSEAVDQPLNDQEDSIVLDDVGYMVTDSDGSTASGSVDITIYDDVPTAVDDGNTATQDVTPVVVDVLSNDISGADDPLELTGASVVGGTATGSASINTATGEVTFTAAEGFDGVATINYTIEDADGDEDTGSFTVTVGDTAPLLSDTDTSVDEDGLGDANADEPTGLESNHGGSATGTGTISVDYGPDVPLNLDTAITLVDDIALDSELTSGGQTVSFTLTGGDLVGTIDSGATEVIRISIDATPNNTGVGEYDYTYTVTLSEAVDQPDTGDANDEDSIVLNGVDYLVTDSDGSTATGSFDVTIYDDVPTAVDDGSTSTADTTPVMVDVLSNDISGADDPIVITGVSVVGGTATGTASFSGDDVTFTAAAGFSGTATVNYTIEDADGDESSASFTVDVSDSTPSSEETDTVVDEDGLVDANADTSLGTETDNNELAVNTGTITVNFGNDVPGDLDAAVVLDDLAGYDNELSSGGQTVVFAKDGDDLVGTIDGGDTEVIRISINDTPADDGGGSYTYTYTVLLSEAVDHPSNPNEDSVVLDDIQYTVSDSDGTTATGTFDVTIWDDVPNLLDGAELTIANMAPQTASTTLTFMDGADDIGDVVFTGVNGVVGTDGMTATDSEGNTIANGDAIFLTGFGTDTLIGYEDTNTNGVYDEGVDFVALTVGLSPETDEWFAQIATDLTNSTEIDFTFAGDAISGGNNDILALGADDPTNNEPNVDLILDGDPGTVNTSQGNIAVGNNQITAGETVKIEFVNNAVTSPDLLDPSGFDWDGQVETTSWEQDITRVAGNGTVQMTVSALATNGDDILIGDNDPTVTITSVSVLDDGGAEIFSAVIADGVDTPITQNGVTATFNSSDGTVSFEGLDEDYRYVIGTDDPFTGVQVVGDPGTNQFALGAATIGTQTSTDPFDMTFDILGTDGDGDPITDTITLNVDPPVEELAEEASLLSFSAFSLEGGEGGSGGTGGEFGAPGGETGGGSGGPQGFLGDFTGEDSQLGGDLLAGIDGQLASFSGPLYAQTSEFGGFTGNLATDLGSDGTPSLDQFQVMPGLEAESFGGDLNLSLTADLSLSDMVEMEGQDLSGLLGEGPELGSVNASASESLDSGLSGGIEGLQIVDEMNYNYT